MEEALGRVFEVVGDVFGGLARGVERSITGMFGSSNARYLRKLQPTVEAINALEPTYQAMTDAELKEQTGRFRKRLSAGQPLEDLLIEAFAVCREVGRRLSKGREHELRVAIRCGVEVAFDQRVDVPVAPFFARQLELRLEHEPDDFVECEGCPSSRW